MSYLTASQFRSGSQAEFTHDLLLSATDVEDDDLITGAISRLSARFDDWTEDHFETSEAQTRALKGSGGRRLYLPHRYTAISQVRIADEDGTWTVQTDPGVYRLHSSLDASGAGTVGDLDYLELLANGEGLSGYPSGFGAWAWPTQANSVEVTGTIGWTVTPGDVKRAVAVLVYDHFKPVRKDLRRAETVANANETVRYITTQPELGIFSGIPEVDEIVARLRRPYPVSVA
jgi:hypothetical protein